MRLKRPPRHVQELRPYRSQAEWVRVRQTWVLVGLSASSVTTNLFIALKVFGVL